MVDNLIRLFDSAETDFSSNGLGILIDAESCLVTEEKNGEFELELIYPINGRLYSEIQLRRIIVARSNPFSNPQPFRIYLISKPFNGRVTINAEHISYDMSGYPVSPFEASSCTDAFDKMKSACATDCPFTFWTDKDVTKEYSTDRPYSMRSLLGGTEGSILSAFGKGEYEFDGYSVKFWLNRGLDRGVTIRYGKNLTDVKQEENCSAVYTGVYPYWYSETEGLQTLSDKIVNVEGTFNFTRILTLDLSDRWTDKPSEDDLREAAENYISNNKIGVPDVSLDVSFEQLSQTKEYELYSLLEEVHLCDTVTVEFPELGVSSKADCIKTVYNVLTNKYKKIELGSSKTNLATTIANQEKSLDETLSKTYLQQSVERATQLISGNAGGYVVIRNSEGRQYPNEILIMDTDNIATAKKVWRWNNSGLGYSATGYEGPYGLAMTIDGEINADYITTGILTAVSIRACDIKCGKISEELTHSSESQLIEEYTFELTSEGEITAKKGTIGKCVIDTDGRLIVPAAHIDGLLEANQINTKELKVSAANITGQLEVSQIKSEDLRLTANQIMVEGDKSLTLALGDFETKDNFNKTLKLYLTNDSFTTTITNYAKKEDKNEAETFSYSLTSTGFKIISNDTTVLNATANGLDIEGKITATSGKIAGWTIASTELYNGKTGILTGDSYQKTSLVTSGEKSSIRFYAGGTSKLTSKFSVLEDGSLYAEAAKISGEITASSGKIGGFTIDSSSLYNNKSSMNASTYTNGVYIGTDGISLGINNKFSVTSAGVLNAVEGKIGGWTLGSTSLSAQNKIGTKTTNVSLSCNNSGSSLDSGDVNTSKIISIDIYDSVSSTTDQKFYVKQNGFLFAKDANIEGTIIATSGKIAGLNITTKTKIIDGTSFTGTALETEENEYFSIFSYSDGSNTGSVIDVDSLNLKNPTFTSEMSAPSLSSQEINAGDVSIKDGKLKYDGRNVLGMDAAQDEIEITATITSYSALSATVKFSFSSPLRTGKRIQLNLHQTWGGWIKRSVYCGHNSTGGEGTWNSITETFWGYDDVNFTATGTKTYTFTQGGTRYIRSYRSIAPDSNGSTSYGLDLGLSEKKWRNIYAATSTIGSSDRNEKKDIVEISDVYGELFDELKPVTYKFIQNTSDRTHIGFIAQDIEESMNKIGLSTKNFAGLCSWTKRDGTLGYGLRYGEFVALNTYEIQKLKKRVAELESKLSNAV